MSIKKNVFKTICLVLMLLIMSTSTIWGMADFQMCDTGLFCDVPEGHWAKEQIEFMAQEGIINGYTDGSFKPDNPVSRAEFAKIMVLTLGLDLKNPSTATFKDIAKDHWAYPYVETAKYYLTGYRNSAGDYYKPDLKAVREDMSVAMVKSLGLPVEDADESVLNRFVDQAAISQNLKKHVAVAVSKELMKGSPVTDTTFKFAPLENVTRAQAATLLYRCMDNDEIKVTYDDDKITYDEYVTSDAPLLTAKVYNGKIALNWSKVWGEGFHYYKVVISKYNSKPKYPDDGYLSYYTDIERTYSVIDNSQEYNGGDLDGHLVSGRKYYVSITAVFEDTKLYSNTVEVTYP